MPLLIAQALLTGLPVDNTGRWEFHLPEIPPEERTQYRGQKIRKHATKRRRNKLHDKRR